MTHNRPTYIYPTSRVIRGGGCDLGALLLLAVAVLLGLALAYSAYCAYEAGQRDYKQVYFPVVEKSYAGE